MFIQTEATPNPATLRYPSVGSRTVLGDGTLELALARERRKGLAVGGRGCSRSRGVTWSATWLELHQRDQGGRRVAASETPSTSAPSWSTTSRQPRSPNQHRTPKEPPRRARSLRRPEMPR